MAAVAASVIIPAPTFQMMSDKRVFFFWSLRTTHTRAVATMLGMMASRRITF